MEKTDDCNIKEDVYDFSLNTIVLKTVNWSMVVGAIILFLSGIIFLYVTFGMPVAGMWGNLREGVAEFNDIVSIGFLIKFGLTIIVIILYCIFNHVKGFRAVKKFIIFGIFFIVILTELILVKILITNWNIPIGVNYIELILISVWIIRLTVICIRYVKNEMKTRLIFNERTETEENHDL